MKAGEKRSSESNLSSEIRGIWGNNICSIDWLSTWQRNNKTRSLSDKVPTGASSPDVAKRGTRNGSERMWKFSLW